MRQIINRGNFPNDPSADNLYNGTEKINQNFEELYGQFNQLISVGTITKEGNLVTVPVAAIWKIAGVQYSNPSALTHEVNYASSGNSRFDLILGNNLNQVVRFQGPEGSIAIRPNVPADHVLITDLLVNDNSIGDPAVPIIGNQFVTKISKRDFKIYDTGSDVVLNFNIQFGYVGYLFLGNITSVDRIEGVVAEGENYPVLGEQYYFVNQKPDGTPLTLKNGFFINLGSVDLVLPFGAVAVYRLENGGMRFISLSAFTQNLDETLGVGNTTNKEIISTLSSAEGIAFKAVNGGRIQATYGVFGELNAGGWLSFSGLVLEDNAGAWRSNAKFKYFNSNVGTNFTGREIPDADWVNSNMLHKTGNESKSGSLDATLLSSGASGINGEIRSYQPDGSFVSLKTNASVFKSGLFRNNTDFFLYYDTADGSTNLQATFETAPVNIKKIDGTIMLQIDPATDSAIFKGTINLGKFTNGTEPALVLGGTYFNTSINKMKIGGASGWEIVSSS